LEKLEFGKKKTEPSKPSGRKKSHEDQGQRSCQKRKKKRTKNPTCNVRVCPLHSRRRTACVSNREAAPGCFHSKGEPKYRTTRGGGGEPTGGKGKIKIQGRRLKLGGGGDAAS